MLSARWLLPLVLVAAACSSNSSPTSTTSASSGVTSGATSSATSAAASGATSGSTLGTSSGTVAATTGTSGATTSSSSTTTTSSSTTGGLATTCVGAGGAVGVWEGSLCVLTTCSPQAGPSACFLPSDGGLGSCRGSVCLTSSYTDINNCGNPGVVCAAGLLCSNGRCQTAGCDPSTCPGSLICDLTGTDGCVLPTCASTDEGLACEIGDAGPDDFNNPLLGACCGGQCTSVYSDSTNCGVCGNACPADGYCQDGICLGTDCATAPTNTGCYLSPSRGGFCCGGVCATSNANNCLSCGATCAVGATCGAGCSASCSAPGQACATGELCEPFSGRCLAPSCTGAADGTTCGVLHPDGLVVDGECCGGSCSDPSIDATNCSACGLACPSGFDCENQRCVPHTDCVGQTDSATCTFDGGSRGQCCGGACVDPSADDLNCTACGAVCPTNSRCVPAPGAASSLSCVSNGVFLACSSTNCPTGTACGVDAFCHTVSCTGVADLTRCYKAGSYAAECCGGTCVDPDDDVANCGGCGVSCPGSAASCNNGSCENNDGCSPDPCPSGTLCLINGGCAAASCEGRVDGDACAYGPVAQGVCCQGSCAYLQSDSENCGGCGLSCDGGACYNYSCQQAYADVSACSPACGPGEVCAASTCVGSTCNPLYSQAYTLSCAARDGNPGLCCDSTNDCADLANDPNNCGECGLSCDGGACLDGLCQGSTCGARNANGFCGTVPGNGLTCCGPNCVNIQSDDNNCSYCGYPCPTGTHCTAGQCM